MKRDKFEYFSVSVNQRTFSYVIKISGLKEETGRIRASRGEEDAHLLADALLCLPPQVRIPLVLHYMEGFSILEIASMLNCPKGTVLSRLDRGRKQLKDLLSKE